jgi:hypothetical protein
MYSIKWVALKTETECVYCAVRTVPLNKPQNIVRFWRYLWLRWIAEGLSTWRSRFDPGLVHVIFVLGEDALRQIYLRLLLMLSVSIITPMDDKSLQLNITFSRRTKRGILGTTQRTIFLMENGYKIYFHSGFKRYEHFTLIYVKCTYKQISRNV